MRGIRKLLGALALVLLLYAGSAVIGGAIAANGAWRQPATGVRIYVVDNGIHTDLVLPAAGFDDLVRPQDIADPAYAAYRWRVFGWGNRDFYRNTPSWWQLNPLRALRALAGFGPTALHVSHVPEPRAGPKVRALVLRPDEYRRLVAYVRASFAPGDAVHGYGGYDAFYPAKGSYNALRTCNEWTAAGLRRAGVRMAAWAPLPFGVMQWL